MMGVLNAGTKTTSRMRHSMTSRRRWSRPVPGPRNSPTFTPTAVRSGGKVVLFDTGLGGNGAPSVGKLAENMKAAGLDPAKVDTVVISHFHADHISGLWAKETSEQIYPQRGDLAAGGRVQAPDRSGSDREAAGGDAAGGAAPAGDLPNWKNVTQYNDCAELAPGVRAIATPGHTPGHIAFLVASGCRQLFIQSDVTGLHHLFVRNPGWHSVFDMDGPKAEAHAPRPFSIGSSPKKA
jgi:glyoxylase-like metal-dependent hydrolase (beta-lactamase superfamily II)